MKGAKGEVLTPFAVSAGILTSWPSTRLASPVESSFPPKPAQRHRTCCRTTCFLGLAILCQLVQTVREELQALVLYFHPNGMENRAEKRANKISVPFCDHSAHPSSLEAQGPVFSLRWTAPALDRWPVHRRSLCSVSTASLSHSLVGLVRGTHSSQTYPPVDTAGARTRRAM